MRTLLPQRRRSYSHEWPTAPIRGGCRVGAKFIPKASFRGEDFGCRISGCPVLLCRNGALEDLAFGDIVDQPGIGFQEI